MANKKKTISREENLATVPPKTKAALTVKPGELIRPKFPIIGLVNRKTPPEKVAAIISDYMDNAIIPNVMGMANALGVHRDTVNEWEKDSSVPFSGILKTAKQMLGEFIVANAFKNRINTVFSIFYMKNCFNWTDKREVETKSHVDVNVNFKEFLKQAKVSNLEEKKRLKDMSSN